MRRHELTDREWERIKELLPAPKVRGRRPSDARQMFNGMLWILRTGVPWRDLPERFGPWETVYTRFNTWCRDGVLERVVSRLQAQMNEQGHFDWELFCVYGSVVRASRAGAGKKRGLPNR